MFETQHGDLNLSRIFEADARPDRPNPGNVPQHPTHREAELEALTIAVPGMLDRSRFLEAVGALPGGVFRMKGVLHFRGEEIPCLVQYVAGRCELSPFPSLGLNDRFLLLVGRDLDKNALRLSFGSLQSS